MNTTSLFAPSRRRLLQGMGAGLATAAMPSFVWGQAAPLKVGFQLHRTGIGAAYGRWYERTATAAATAINGAGGIAGRQIELVFEDDATDPKRGAEVVEKLAGPAGCDLIMGTLFSHVVMGSAPRAGELKIPYLVCSEGYHVASGALVEVLPQHRSIELGVYAVYPSRKHLTAKVRAMIDFLLDAFRMQAWPA